MKHLSIIVAMTEERAIGRDNKLLWHISEDLKRFKKLTSGHTVVMGKKTYYSLPIRPLPNRTNVVLTDDPNDAFEGCQVAFSVSDAIEKCEEGKENFVIGGGSVYRQFLDYADKLYITMVHHKFEADTFFPEIDEKVWKLTSEEKHPARHENELSYSYLIYERRE